MTDPAWKIRKTIDALRKFATDDHEMLTLLMHVAAALFAKMREREGTEETKAAVLDWFKHITQMLDGKFDRDSSVS